MKGKTVQVRLRIYDLVPETGAEFVAKWQEDLLPLREELGFKVLNAFHDKENSQFFWAVAWPGEGSYEDAEAAYYASPLREKVSWDARDYITAIQIKTVTVVL